MFTATHFIMTSNLIKTTILHLGISNLSILIELRKLKSKQYNKFKGLLVFNCNLVLVFLINLHFH